MIAEDHAVTGWGLAFLISGLGQYELIDHLTDGNAVIRAVAAHKPDLLILDLGLPGVDGLTILAEVSRSTSVLVFSGRTEARDFELARRAGALGLVSKADSPDVIVEALRVVSQREQYISRYVRDLIGP
jgi:DNA-binding NarL/FixJ family response regulator